MEKELEAKVAKLQELVDGSDNIVFFGGAGVSTESGIPDFRSQDGLYNQKYDFPPETILSHSFFMRNTAEFYRFYKEKILLVGSGMDPKPNAAHLKLAELEQAGTSMNCTTRQARRRYMSSMAQSPEITVWTVIKSLTWNTSGSRREYRYAMPAEG